MILDTLQQWHHYRWLGDRFERAFEYLAHFDPATPDGRHEIDGSDVYASVMRYTTRLVDQFKFEAHREYADVQFIVSGRERILWAPLASLVQVTEPYDAAKDLIFFAPPAVWTPLQLGAGQFAVFLPEDGHAPSTEWGGVCDVLKVVMKVRV
jgi:YhcH/YjgK/YiaL family protein